MARYEQPGIDRLGRHQFHLQRPRRPRLKWPRRITLKARPITPAVAFKDHWLAFSIGVPTALAFGVDCAAISAECLVWRGGKTVDDGAPTSKSEPTKPGDPRIEGNYLQALLQFWTSTNLIIWQQISITIATQTTAIVVAYTLRGSLSSYVVMFMAIFVSTLLFTQLVSNIQVRNKLTRQADFISSELLKPFVEGRNVPNDVSVPLVLFPWRVERTYWFVRGLSGAIAVWLILVIFDVIISVSINVPRLSICLHELLPWLPPLFPPKWNVG
jgi:hypothetical protein